MKLVGSVDLNPRRGGPSLRLLLAVLVGLALVYLFAWPTRVDPEAWTAPPSTPRIGPLRENGALAKVEWLLRGQGIGPESIAIDPQGMLVTGYVDGRIVRASLDGKKVEPIVNTGGRPLGLSFNRQGVLHVADAYRGLLRIVDGKVEVLATEQGGVPFRFTDDLDIAADGTIYFSDASSRFGLDQYIEDLLEHRGSGRLLSYSPKTKETSLLLSDLRFANGVALWPDQQSVLVNEMGNYRIIRYFISGARRGQHEVFAAGLPGFPDNLTLAAGRDRFWVALASPRDAAIDLLSNWPRLRRVVARLPAALRPRPARYAQLVAIGLDGKIIDSLDDASPGSYSPLSSVREYKGSLYLGSFQREGIGRIGAP